MIERARFSLFDITQWNPNVTLELGIAMGKGVPYYLLFNRASGDDDVPADLRGLGRLEYGSYGQLQESLTRLLLQEVGAKPPEGRQITDKLDLMRARVPVLVGEQPGMKIREIAERLDVGVDLAQLVVRPLVDVSLGTTGRNRGTRYYLIGDTPKRRTPPR